MAARILLVCLLSSMIITRAIGLPELVGIKVGMILIFKKYTISTQFLVFPISTRVDITVYQHGKCFIFLL